jgi:hypothetical protein
MMRDDPELVVLMADGVVNEALFDVLLEENPSFADYVRRSGSPIDYSTRCPDCGAILIAVAGPPELAPWGCRPCGVQWWTTGLTDFARGIYQPELGWRQPDGADVVGAVELEKEDAEERGTSLRPDQLLLFDDEGLAFVLSNHGPRLHPNFAAAVAAELDRGGDRRWRRAGDMGDPWTL